jgi:hypothetical protein
MESRQINKLEQILIAKSPQFLRDLLQTKIPATGYLPGAGFLFHKHPNRRICYSLLSLDQIRFSSASIFAGMGG